MLCFQSAKSQSHTQKAAMTHVRMMQQMNHNFHMMNLYAARQSNRKVKKNIKNVKKNIKFYNKANAKYKRKIIKLDNKLQNTDVFVIKKRKKLEKKIAIYKTTIESNKQDISELNKLLNELEKIKAQKEAEKKAKKEAKRKLKGS